MATYLKEYEVGTDPTLIGFPGLGGCMGLVVKTNNGLFGYHNPPLSNNRTTAFADAFAGQTAQYMISVCRFNNRYSEAEKTGTTKVFAWMDDVEDIAKKMKHKGRVIGLNLSQVLGIDAADKAESGYCEVQLMGGAAQINYSITSDVQADSQAVVGTSVRRVDSQGTQHKVAGDKVVHSVVSTKGGFSMSDGVAGTFEITI